MRNTFHPPGMLTALLGSTKWGKLNTEVNRNNRIDTEGEHHGR